MSEFEGKSFHMVEKEDLDYVTGGAPEVQNVPNSQQINLENCKQTFRTNGKCDFFEKREAWMTLDTCDNCKYAIAKSDNSDIVYCTNTQVKKTGNPIGNTEPQSKMTF